MIKALARLLGDLKNEMTHASSSSTSLTTEGIELLSAILMTDVMASDGTASHDEQQQIRDILQQDFSLNAHLIDEIIANALDQSRQATSLYEFTRDINPVFSPQQKLQLIEHLWHVAYADNHIHQLEEALIRQIADLIHVPQATFIHCKLKARDHRAATVKP